MQIILIRHGHKAMLSSNNPDNPPLSTKGTEQAAKLLELAQKSQLPHPTECWYSDKVRTEQTLEKLILFYKPLKLLKPELSVRKISESLPQFRERIQKTINALTAMSEQKKSACIYICTHYDWIEESLTIIDSNVNLNSFEYASWSPAQYIVFEVIDGIWNIKSKGCAHVI